MFLRSLVTHWFRQQVHEQLHESLAEAVKQSAATEGDPDPDATLPPQPCGVGFLFALGIEAGGLVDRLDSPVVTRGGGLVEHVGDIDGRRVAIVEAGVGRRAAESGCRDLIAVRRPQWVVSAGFAGGLSPALRPGHILMADHVTDLSGRSLSVGLKLDEAEIAARPSLHVGRLLTVDKVIGRAEAKRRLGAEHQAVACDMESMAVAGVCREAGIRFLSVRIVSDAVEDDLPPDLEHLVQQKTVAGKLGAVTGAIFRNPGSVKQMWRLKTDALKFSDDLAQFLCGVLPQLE